MSEVRTFRGGCHCGAVRYEVTMALEGVVACNCSICSKTGGLLAFAPRGQFKLLSGEDQLTDYLFNKHVIHHNFCKTCGVRSFAYGKNPRSGEMAAINVRCLDDVEVSALPVKHFDGKSL